MTTATERPARALDLQRLMAPASVAVVGATDRAGSYAAQTLLNLESIGFAGPVWGVNPRRTEVLGRPCVPSVADLPEPVDAVVVAIPAAGVGEAIEQAGARGCGGAVVFSAGFAEVPGGVSLQDELVAAAGRHRLPVCGPNGNGIVSPVRRVALWGDALGPLEAGSVALVSQSGNVAVNALSSRRGLHFHTVIASGNQAVLSAADYLQFLAAEEDVRSVALYLEDDGGPGLCNALAACADRGVAVAVLKVGSSAIGARAAAAHSGALAGDQRVFRSLVAEAGAVWADDVHELLELAKTLAVRRRRRWAGSDSPRGLAIMTCSGGDSAQGADEAAQLGLDLPQLSTETLERLSELLPSAATAANPLDYTSMVWGDVPALSELVRALGEDPAIGLVLVFYDQPAGLTGAMEESWRDVRDGVIRGAALSPVGTLVSSTLPELLDGAAAAELAAAGVPAAAGLRTGLRCARALLAPGEGDAARLRAIAATARGRAPRDGAWLPEHAAKQQLREAGVPVPDGRVVSDGDDAVRALAELQPSIALKLSAASVQHKSELDGVALGLQSAPEVHEAYARLAVLAGELGGVVLAEEMAPAGVELIVAAHDDGVVPALVLGLGGIWTELLDDVAVVPLPADVSRVRAALLTLRAAPLLLGARGAQAVDLEALARLAARVGELVAAGEASLVECNPVLAGPGGAIAVDAAVRR
ncbi:MAG TPA: acetate--CoA ligase family protein [Solirubrobacteraceae bacterium]|nr:acetate--CoA ligase family protein [Solirubrobacteraceae bacterium]